MSDELAAAKRWRGDAAALVAEELAKQKPAAADPAPLHAALGRGAPPGKQKRLRATRTSKCQHDCDKR